MKQKKLIILLPLLIIVLAGCGTSPENPTGPDTTGFFENIVKFFSYGMIYLGNILGGSLIWGLIAMTIIIRGLLFPLYRMQMKSQEDMKLVKPDMKKIEEKYKDKNSKEDKTKKNQELQALYREHNINPLAGCLSMLIQLPLLFTFYGAILNLLVYEGLPLYSETVGFAAEELKTTFLGLDMSEASIMFAAIAAFTTYLTMMVSSSANDEEGAARQMMVMMKYMMPAMIFFFGLKVPAALALYWIIGNLMSIFQTLIYRRTHNQTDKDRKKIEEQSKK